MTDIFKRRLDIKGQSPEEERLLAMIAALASELSITRERLDTVERLLEADGVLDRTAIERFSPQPAQTTERDSIRRRLIATIFRPLKTAAIVLAQGVK